MPKAKKAAKVYENGCRTFAFRVSMLNSKKYTDEQAIAWYIGQKEFLTSLYDKYIFQLEDSWMGKGEAHVIAENKKGNYNNYHIQGIGYYDKRMRPTTMKKLLLENWKGHSVYCEKASAAGEIQLRKYCMKMETRVAGSATTLDATVYVGEDLMSPSQFFPWQTMVKDIYDSAPDPRRMWWFYDPVGGGGKSAIAKYMSFHYGVPVFTFAKAWDLLKVCAEFPNKRMYILNLTKSKPNDIGMSELYTAIESIKDGMFLTSKGSGVRTVLMNKPHFIVFANQLPNMRGMTRERFEIVTVPPMPARYLKVAKRFDVGKYGLKRMTDAQIQAGYEREQAERDADIQDADQGPARTITWVNDEGVEGMDSPVGSDGESCQRLATARTTSPLSSPWSISQHG